MPHDKYGRLVEVGDWVKGKPYNTRHRIVGVITFLNPEREACNAEVAFLTPWEGVKKDYCETRQMDLVMKADGSDPLSIPPRPTWLDEQEKERCSQL